VQAFMASRNPTGGGEQEVSDGPMAGAGIYYKPERNRHGGLQVSAPGQCCGAGTLCAPSYLTGGGAQQVNREWGRALLVCAVVQPLSQEVQSCSATTESTHVMPGLHQLCMNHKETWFHAITT
jgi:hypothetical protein